MKCEQPFKLVDTLNQLRNRDANIARQNTDRRRLNSATLRIPPLEILQVNLLILPRERGDINHQLNVAKVIRAELRNLKALNSRKKRVPAQN
jgi:hypothetical protein